MMVLALAAQDTTLARQATSVWDWLTTADQFATPVLLVLLVVLTALWHYWRRERTRGRAALLILVLLATLLFWLASLVPRLRLVTAGAGVALLMAAATRFAWSWISYTGRPEGLEPEPEALDALEDVVIDRLEDGNDVRPPESESITELHLGDRPPLGGGRRR